MSSPTGPRQNPAEEDWQRHPHEALEMKPPASVFVPSRRHMPEKPKSPEYPDTMKVRKLDSLGRLAFAGQTTKTVMSRLLAREPIGLKPMDEDRWEVFYGSVLIAEVMLRGKEIRLDRKR